MAFEWDLDSMRCKDFALLVLNQPFNSREKVTQLWNKAKFKVLVDGGSNQWFDLVKDQKVAKPLPDLVTGDFDSIRPEVLAHYKSQSEVKVIPTPDQDHTDFTKALIEVERSQVKVDSVLAFIENRGRLDQILANIETLFHAKEHLHEDKTLFLVSSETISWLLQPGTHDIAIPADLVRDSSHVGLIPVGEPVPGVVTSGLKWDLDGSRELAFGKLVSTSNGFQSKVDKVTVKTPKPLLITLEYN